MGGRCAELVQRAAVDTQKSLLFQAAVGYAGKPKGMGTSRGSSQTHRRNRPPKKSRRAPTPHFQAASPASPVRPSDLPTGRERTGETARRHGLVVR